VARTRALLADGGALVVVLGLVGVPGNGPAMASTPQAGTVVCRSISGTIRFDPPLEDNGTSAEVASLKIAVTRCRASGSGATPHRGKAVAALPTATNSCADVTSVGFRGTSLDVKWSPTSIGHSAIDFAAFTPLPGAKVALAAGGAGTTVVGSYPGTDVGASSTATMSTTMSTAQLAAACRSHHGLKALQIRSGSLAVA